MQKAIMNNFITNKNKLNRIESIISKEIDDSNVLEKDYLLINDWINSYQNLLKLLEKKSENN